MPTIDADRLLAELRALAEIGRYRTGVHRPTYSAEDMAAREWLAGRLRETGREVVIDGIGNVLGRHPGDGSRLLVGSHVESQNQAGWLDGALGVIYGLELARPLGENPATRDLPVDV
jgi:N-carbamoyl-L-amino-acid hydrolase